jgi:protein-S-isoprenylcysteine O-methyltransferase Ste14
MSDLEYAISSIAGILFLIQVLSLAFIFNPQMNLVLLGVGWVMLIPSFSLLMLAANIRGLFNTQSKQEKSGNELLEKRGIYAIVRHPAYLGWILMSLSIALICQFWSSILLSALVIPLVVLMINLEEKRNALKFNDEYVLYQTEVPMMNIFLGMWRKKMQKRSL